HPRQPPAFAHSDLVVQTIDLAVAGTDTTGPQRFERVARSLLKNAFLECAQVSRGKILACQQKSAVATQLDRQRRVASAFHRAVKGAHGLYLYHYWEPGTIGARRTLVAVFGQFGINI